MRIVLAAAALALPTTLFAAGGGDETAPPKPASACKGAQVYDEKTKTCVNPQDSSLQIEQLYDTVRQLAYAGRYDDAQGVLSAMPEQDDRRLTYMGFTERKMGNVDTAMVYYKRAITQNPANILARSYMGQGLVEQGQISLALAELRAIRAHGGTGTWAETSLRNAIATGTTYDY
jgi:tetratricopeptide (TPR) repeat protein